MPSMKDNATPPPVGCALKSFDTGRDFSVPLANLDLGMAHRQRCGMPGLDTLTVASKEGRPRGHRPAEQVPKPGPVLGPYWVHLDFSSG
jgi:hypothetical protein